MEFSTMPQFLPISKHSLIQDAVSFTKELRTSLQRDSPVNRSQLQESEKERTTQETCGPKQLRLLNTCIPGLFCLKMCQASSHICPWLSEICEELAIPLKSPLSLLLPRWVIPIKEKGFGYLPTPTATCARRNAHKVKTIIKRLQQNIAGVNLCDWERLNKVTIGSIKRREWMMGLPEGWMSLKPLAICNYLIWFKQHGGS